MRRIGLIAIATVIATASQGRADTELGPPYAGAYTTQSCSGTSGLSVGHPLLGCVIRTAADSSGELSLDLTARSPRKRIPGRASAAGSGVVVALHEPTEGARRIVYGLSVRVARAEINWDTRSASATSSSIWVGAVANAPSCAVCLNDGSDEAIVGTPDTLLSQTDGDRLVSFELSVTMPDDDDEAESVERIESVELTVSLYGTASLGASFPDGGRVTAVASARVERIEILSMETL